MSAVQYGDALAALHGVYAQAEAWVLGFLERNPDLFDYGCRCKMPALDADLAALGRTPVPSRINFTAPPTVGALIGILCTLEGSTLGGQFIARGLSQISVANLPMQFFTGYGHLSRQRWEAFLRLADVTCPAAGYEEATASAVALFAAIKNHLDGAVSPISHRQ